MDRLSRGRRRRPTSAAAAAGARSKDEAVGGRSKDGAAGARSKDEGVGARPKDEDVDGGSRRPRGREGQLDRLNVCEWLNSCRRAGAGALARWAREHSGQTLELPWPSGCTIIFGHEEFVRLFGADLVRRCQTEYFDVSCELQLIGSIRHERYAYPLLLDGYGRVYAHYARDDSLFELAESFTEFLGLGLVRFEPAHLSPNDLAKAERHTEALAVCNLHWQASERVRYLRSMRDFRSLLALEDPAAIAAHVRQYRGLSLSLTWPLESFLILSDAATLGVSELTLKRLQSTLPVVEPLCILGVVAQSSAITSLSSFQGLIILLSDGGVVYAYSPGSERVQRVAVSLLAFVRVGLGRLIGDYHYERIGSALWEPGVASSEEQLPLKKRRSVSGAGPPGRGRSRRKEGVATEGGGSPAPARARSVSGRRHHALFFLSPQALDQTVRAARRAVRPRRPTAVRPALAAALQHLPRSAAGPSGARAKSVPLHHLPARRLLAGALLASAARGVDRGRQPFRVSRRLEAAAPLPVPRRLRAALSARTDLRARPAAVHGLGPADLGLRSRRRARLRADRGADVRAQPLVGTLSGGRPVLRLPVVRTRL
ncbi:T29 [Tupaiid betaherpesvirus 1]|uniref:T29 n=1 Tax=Tupaiid herpesvirus 1 (strain 1) TaxID=10397 RepID=Q91TR7_TUHV1|nr:T29 [Tupaiid betaherpesvirus 1]AAK57070.1 T29 [Tupaiid betaherpesvirus 1]